MMMHDVLVFFVVTLALLTYTVIHSGYIKPYRTENTSVEYKQHRPSLSFSLSSAVGFPHGEASGLNGR